MNLCVIPARGGSKRIPRKNIRNFCGKPILAWSIEAALKSESFDEILVSTDDDEIREVALRYGAKAPFNRPDHLSDDNTAVRPVIIHAINEAQALYGPIEFSCCVCATAPFIRPDDIADGLKMLTASNYDFVFTVTQYPYPIQRALRLKNGNQLEMFWPEYRLRRSQDLEVAYHDAAQFYWGRSTAFLLDKPTFSNHSIPFILPQHRVKDIDTLDDWDFAERLFRSALTES